MQRNIGIVALVLCLAAYGEGRVVQAPADIPVTIVHEPEAQPLILPKETKPEKIEEEQQQQPAGETNSEPQLEKVDQQLKTENIEEIGAERQATQATPTQQSSTQQNFVQQLIQNSPLGQFLNQFNPNQQQQSQQSQQQQQQQQPQADELSTPAPTQPGFLNPAAAITSAQQAVQNAAQTVVNSTSQAFQGIQQFANNLGTQFQNTLSGLTGQNSGQSTTPRPPGPIQSFVNNVFGGGGNNATAASPSQQQGPLQGFINFLGGNRPQNAPVPAVAEVTAAPKPTKKPDVDDKIDEAPESDDANEVRNSAEAVDDSFEEAVPVDEVIVVNDDASGDVAPEQQQQVEPVQEQEQVVVQKEETEAAVAQ